MNRTQRAEVGLRPALSANETTAGQLARTFAELDSRELGAMHYEMTCPAAAVRTRAEDAAGMAWAKLQAVPLATFERGTAGLVWSCAYWAAIP